MRRGGDAMIPVLLHLVQVVVALVVVGFFLSVAVRASRGRDGCVAVIAWAVCLACLAFVGLLVWVSFVRA